MCMFFFINYVYSTLFKVPEIIYASAKAATSASEDELDQRPKKLARLRQTKSKSLDDICLKFSKKAKKRQKEAKVQ